MAHLLRDTVKEDFPLLYIPTFCCLHVNRQQFISCVYVYNKHTCDSQWREKERSLERW